MLAAAVWAATVAGVAAAANPATPVLDGRVTDTVALLPVERKAALAQTLADYERETTHQIAVLIVDTLAGEPIDAYARRVANAWGLGRRDMNNGILVVVAVADRAARIQLGYGFERYISDAQSAEILRVHMIPAFRRNEYAQGLELGIRELMRQGRELKPPRKPWWG
jgi:uncharacterized protein